MDRKTSIKILTQLSQDDTTALDSRNYDLFERFLKACLKARFISRSEETNFIQAVKARQKKLFDQVIRDDDGKVITKSIYKDGRLIEQPMTWAMVLEYDTDEVGNKILGTHRIRDGDLTQTDADGNTTVQKAGESTDSTAYKAYRSEMFRQHKERMLGMKEIGHKEPDRQSKYKVSTGTNVQKFKATSPMMEPLPLLLLVLIGALTGLLGMRKGYSFFCWLFAFAGSNLICFVVLPFMKDVNKAPLEDRARLIRKGNITGLVMSLAFPAILLISAIFRGLSGQ